MMLAISLLLAAQVGAGELEIAREALRDGLYEIARRHAGRSFDPGAGEVIVESYARENNWPAVLELATNGYYRALALYKTGRSQEALETLGKPADDSALKLKAQIDIDGGRFKEALESLGKVETPDDELRFMTAECQLKTGNRKEAEKIWRSLLPNPEAAICLGELQPLRDAYAAEPGGAAKSRLGIMLGVKLLEQDDMGEEEFALGLSDTLKNKKVENEIKSVFIGGYEKFLNKSDKLDAAISELTGFMEKLKQFGVKNAEIDLSIARGLAYYTGLVFEFKLTDHPELQTAAGGGRYADLVEKFSKTKIIGVGAAIGFSRIFVALMESGAIDLSRWERLVDVAILVMGDDNLQYALTVESALRAAKIPSVAYLDTDKKFKNQIEYADKIMAKYSMIIGEDEVKNKQVSVKDMATGEQKTLSVADAIKLVAGGAKK